MLLTQQEVVLYSFEVGLKILKRNLKQIMNAKGHFPLLLFQSFPIFLLYYKSGKINKIYSFYEDIITIYNKTISPSKQPIINETRLDDNGYDFCPKTK